MDRVLPIHNFDHRFDVPRALGGAQRLIGNAEEAVAAAREAP